MNLVVTALKDAILYLAEHPTDGSPIKSLREAHDKAVEIEAAFSALLSECIDDKSDSLLRPSMEAVRRAQKALILSPKG